MTKADPKNGPNKPTNDIDTSCGCGSWRPPSLQYFASARYFTLNFSIVGILQGALFTYTVGIMSTLEKRYAFESKVSGFILIADNLSGMFSSPLIGYLGSKYNRSTLIAIGECIVAVSALANVLPYYLYGPGMHLLDATSSSTTHLNNSLSSVQLCSSTEEAEMCAENGTKNSSTVVVAVAIFWLCSFANGIGYTAFHTIGLPYIDDNIPKKNSAIYLSYLAMMRLLGPAIGFTFASFCLNFYENPFIDPGISRHDARWIGAWWLGFIILGSLIIIFSIPLMMFPVKLRENKRKTISSKDTPKFDGAWSCLKRLSTNYLFLFHIFSSVFRLIGYLGYYIMKPKYIMLQYRQSASSASFFTGATSVGTMAFGTMTGGVFIKFFKPKPRTLASLILFVELFSAIGIFSSMFISCPTPQFSSLPNEPSACSSNCHCTTKVYSPVCAADGITNYFSQCYAGCSSYQSDSQKFSNCSCTGESNNAANWVSKGSCQSDCNNFPLYIFVLSLCNFIASTARSGDTIITLRSVEERDKSFAFGVIGTVFSIFAFTPYPLIFGAIIDSTCLVWESSCGKHGNCWLYDIDSFRVNLHLASAAFLMAGIALAVGTIVFANRIENLYEETEDSGHQLDINGTAKSENSVELSKPS